jgi:hypothetical protein
LSFVELTEFGWRYRIARSRSDFGEPHPGEALSALAEAGVPLTKTAVACGRRFRVAELVDECAGSFAFNEDIEWRSVALALYRPQVRQWTTRSGELVSFDLITKELLRRTRARGSDQYPCFGTHTLYALAMFLSVDGRISLWNDRSLQSSVVASLTNASESLAAAQLGDGSWDQGWELPTPKRAGTTLDDRTRALVTGHHLEWLAVVSDDLRPPHAVLLAAGEFLLRWMSRLRPDQITEEICACSHGLRAFGNAGIEANNESVAHK